MKWSGLFGQLFNQLWCNPAVVVCCGLCGQRAALSYQAQHGDLAPDEFLFMKPIAAGPGDQVCNHPVGLFLNGRRLAAAASHDARGNPLPIWNECRLLKNDEFFMLSDYASNSFDSRYFGPIRADEIIGVYSTAF